MSSSVLGPVNAPVASHALQAPDDSGTLKLFKRHLSSVVSRLVVAEGLQASPAADGPLVWA